MERELKGIGARIRRARERKGLSQAELAEKLQLSDPYMSKIELGKTRFNILHLKNMSAVLGVSADWLLFSDNDNASTEISKEIIELLDGCSQVECEEIFKIMRQLKTAFYAVREIDNQ